MSQLSPPEIAWVEVAQTLGNLETEIAASALRTANIPVYIEAMHGMPSIFGHMATPFTIYVPEAFYEAALDLLEGPENTYPLLDEPSLRFGESHESDADSD